MKVRINVTQRDIKEGEPRNGYLCPVARAVRRHLADGRFVNVSDHLRIGGLTEAYPLPSRITEFITQYDRFEIVNPVRFSIDLPEEYLKKSKKAD